MLFFMSFIVLVVEPQILQYCIYYPLSIYVTKLQHFLLCSDFLAFSSVSHLFFYNHHFFCCPVMKKDFYKSLFFILVEAGGIEPPSGTISTGFSTGVVCNLFTLFYCVCKRTQQAGLLISPVTPS